MLPLVLVLPGFAWVSNRRWCGLASGDERLRVLCGPEGTAKGMPTKEEEGVLGGGGRPGAEFGVGIPFASRMGWRGGGPGRPDAADDQRIPPPHGLPSGVFSAASWHPPPGGWPA